MSVEWAESILGRLSVSKVLLEKLFGSCLENEDFVTIVQYLFQNPQPEGREKALEDLFKAAAESRFTVEEWTATMAMFIVFVREKRVTTTLNTMIGYIACAAVSNDAKIGQIRLKPLVRQFLNTHGFENQM